MITEEKITIIVLHAECGRCGHKWDLKRGVVPKTCPVCHSPYWNKERVHAPHVIASKALRETIEAQREAAAFVRAKIEAGLAEARRRAEAREAEAAAKVDAARAQMRNQ